MRRFREGGIWCGRRGRCMRAYLDMFRETQCLSQSEVMLRKINMRSS